MKKIALMFLLMFSTTFGGEPDIPLHKQCLYPSTLVGSQYNGGSAVIVKSKKVKDGEYHNVAFSVAHVFVEQVDGAGKTFIPTYTIHRAIYQDWSEVLRYESYKVTVKRIDRKRDVAVITFISKEQLPAATPDFNPKLFIGNEIIKIGCGIADEPRVDFGRITSVNAGARPNLPDGAIRINAFTVPGDSGGGVFHKNKLIGLTSGVNIGQNCIGFIVPLYNGFTEEDLNNN